MSVYKVGTPNIAKKLSTVFGTFFVKTFQPISPAAPSTTREYKILQTDTYINYNPSPVQPLTLSPLIKP